MKTLLTLIFIFGLLIHPGPAYSGETFEERIQSQMPDLLMRYHVPGAVVAYIQNGSVTWTRAYGEASTTTGAPMQPDMLMNFGSCGKVLTGWGVMRLVEMGKVELDAPANRYLKRWQIPSGVFDAEEVTVRRLLSHTGGLNIHGYSDYSAGRSMPSLVEMLEGQNQLDGRAEITWEPGTQFHYSGAGYVLLQMLIEDVSGEHFADFMQREVTGALGMTSLQWAWTPELERSAAVPHGSQGEPVGYRQLASAGIGSEISTTADFARFLAAAVPGPNGEPAGRGVLSPETIREMTTIQPNMDDSAGLAYGIARMGQDTLLMHFGANLGWNAFFLLDLERREGVVVATNSANGFALLTVVQDLWSQSVLGIRSNVYPPANDLIGMQGKAALILTGVLGLVLLIWAGRFALQLRRGLRQRAELRLSRLLRVLPWALMSFLWWYWIYAPNRDLLPHTFPEVWPIPQAAYVLAVLLALTAFSAATSWFPKKIARSSMQWEKKET